MMQSIPERWAQIGAEELGAELAANTGLVLVDVRTPDEIAETGSIEGAVSHPLESMLEMRDEWPAQEASIVVYDADGYRGNLAMTVLRTYGYRDVRNLEGGFSGWLSAELPVVTG